MPFSRWSSAYWWRVDEGDFPSVGVGEDQLGAVGEALRCGQPTSSAEGLAPGDAGGGAIMSQRTGTVAIGVGIRVDLYRGRLRTSPLRDNGEDRRARRRVWCRPCAGGLLDRRERGQDFAGGGVEAVVLDLV